MNHDPGIPRTGGRAQALFFLTAHEELWQRENMEAGKELDYLVAEKVLDWQWWRSEVTGRRDIFPPTHRPDWFVERASGDEPLTRDCAERHPLFSVRLSAAWTVFENLTERGWHVMLRFDPERKADKWTCTVSRVPFGTNARVDAATVELAICLAALEAVKSSAEEGGVG